MILGEIIGELIEAVVCAIGDSSIAKKDKLPAILFLLGVIGVICLIVYLI